MQERFEEINGRVKPVTYIGGALVSCVGDPRFEQINSRVKPVTYIGAGLLEGQHYKVAMMSAHGPSWALCLIGPFFFVVGTLLSLPL